MLQTHGVVANIIESSDPSKSIAADIDDGVS